MLRIEFARESKLEAYLRFVQENVRPTGRLAGSFHRDLRTIAMEEHRAMLVAGADRFGNPRAPLAESTLKKRRGPGPSLIPRGLFSRFATNVQGVWQTIGGVPTLVLAFVNIVDRKGRSFAQYHLQGCPRGSNPARPNWSLSKRDVGGLWPPGVARARDRFAQFREQVARGH